MQKKEIKSKNPNISKKQKERNKKINNNFKIAALLAAIALLLTTFMTLGLLFTVAVAILLLIITGIFYLLVKIKSKKKKRQILSIFLILFLIMGIGCLSLFSAFLFYVKTQADPKFKQEKLNTLEISRIYDKDGNEFAKLGSEKREKVTYDELPEVLVDAIIATEDSRFFQHNGFDAPRFIKATLGQISGNSGAGGASTLSMQVVKNSFTSTEAHGIEGVIRKFEDIYLAVFKLEKEYTKEQIIEYYVNNHFLGGNTYGVEEASNQYFGKSVSELNLSEAAILAGMFKSPNYYRPTTNPLNAAARRKTVLYLMKKHGYITTEEEKIANAIPVDTMTADASEIKANEYQGYIDTVVEEVKDKYGVNPYTTPLLVYTNLDRSRQNAVNSVLNGETYSWINDKVQTGVSVLDSESGKILAIGNGRNTNSRNNSTLGQFNYATDLKRQPGSTAKPLFDYGPGMEFNNWSTYERFNDAPYTYSNGRSISNWDNSYMWDITLRKALSASRNIPALKAFQSVDNRKIIEFVTSLGIKPEIDEGRIHEAHAIGAFTGVSPLQMSAAYAAFSNGGYYNEPYSVSKIIFRQTGQEIEHKSDKKQVMSDSTAFMIASVLQDVALTDGTPKNVAAKTGTTNYDDVTMEKYGLPRDAVRDNWVVGFSTKTTIAVWYGYDYIDSEYCLRQTPATMAKDRIFRALVNSGAMESNREAFNPPSSVVRVAVSDGTNPAKLAFPGQSGNVVYEYFKKGTEPTEYDTASVKLGKPEITKISDTNGKVTITWNSVSPGVLADPSKGKFGYNVYKDNVLIDWTDKTSYTFSPSGSVYGTYKVIATYKSYSGVQSEAAERKHEKQTSTPSPTTTTSPTHTTSPSPTHTTSPSPTTTTEPQTP